MKNLYVQRLRQDFDMPKVAEKIYHLKLNFKFSRKKCIPNENEIGKFYHLFIAMHYSEVKNMTVKRKQYFVYCGLYYMM